MRYSSNTWSSENPSGFPEWAERSPSWRYLDEPALTSLVKTHLTPRTVALDLGCGGGRVTRMLQKLGVPEEALYALDCDSGMVAAAKLKCPGVTVFQHDLTDLPYPHIQQHVNLVIAHQVFQYLRLRELRACLSEVFRILKPNGILVVGLPHPIKVARQAGISYFARGGSEIPAPWGGKTCPAGLTVSDYLNTIIDVGFKLLRIDEPEVNSQDEALIDPGGPTRLMILAAVSG